MSATAPIERPTPPRFLTWLALALIFVTPGQLAYAVDPKHGPFIALADVLAVMVGGLFFLWVLFAGLPEGWPTGLRGRLSRVSWPPLPAWAWVAVAVLSGLGAESPKAAALEIIQLVLYFGVVYMLFANVLVSEQQRRQAVRVLLVATTLAVGYALFQYFTANDPLAVKSLFQSRTAYSGFLVLVLPLFLGLTLWSELAWERYWCGLLAVVGGLTILAPPMVWVVAIVCVTMAATWGRSHLLVKAAAAALVFMAVTVALVPLNRQVFQDTLDPYEEGPVYKVMQVAGEEGAADQTQGPIVKKRWIEWMPSLNMLAENFVLGVGAGNYQLNIGQPQYYGFLPNVKKSEPDTNSLYLVTAGSMGLAGLVCLLAFIGHYWHLAGSLWMHAQTPFGRALACGLYGACVALLIGSLFTSVFVRGTALAWALIFALIAGMAREGVMRTRAASAPAPSARSKGF